MERLTDAIFTGVGQGATIALVALGYTMVFGVLRMINFAHGEVFMVGAYAGLFAITAAGGAGHPLLATALAIAFAMAVSAAVGVAVERFAYRPLRRGGSRSALARRAPLVTALGVSVLLQNLAQLFFSAAPRPYPRLFGSTRLVVFAVAAVVMAALEVLVKRSWLGLAMRMVSSNEESARLVGVRPDRTIAATFAVGSALAGLGAVLFCLDQSQATPTMGTVLGTRAFVAAVVGGIGSLPGAMVGGLVIGIVGELAKLTDYAGGVDVIVFVVLVVVLLVRPHGLFGRAADEKV